MKFLILAHSKVGYEITNWLVENYNEDISLVVTIEEDDISQLCRKNHIPCIMFHSNESLVKFFQKKEFQFDFGLLLWWPKIVKPPLLEYPNNGFINTHPSLLPNNRGKHPNFWAIVEELPFGVTLHFIDDGVDTGDIIFERPIPYTWENTGKDLYVKALRNMVDLFIESYPLIREKKFERKKQHPEEGSFHLAEELESASRIDLTRKYPARKLINLLRARSFKGHPACWFEDSTGKYEIRVEIKRL